MKVLGFYGVMLVLGSATLGEIVDTYRIATSPPLPPPRLVVEDVEILPGSLSVRQTRRVVGGDGTPLPVRYSAMIVDYTTKRPLCGSWHDATIQRRPGDRIEMTLDTWAGSPCGNVYGRTLQAHSVWWWPGGHTEFLSDPAYIPAQTGDPMP